MKVRVYFSTSFHMPTAQQSCHLLIAVLKLKFVFASYFDSMDTVNGNQCQLAASNSLGNNELIVKVSMATVCITILGIISVLVIYSVIVVIIGYCCGFRIVKCKTLIGKVTMTPVTYTAVRNVQHPSFECSTLIEGCWEFSG